MERDTSTMPQKRGRGRPRKTLKDNTQSRQVGDEESNSRASYQESQAQAGRVDLLNATRDDLYEAEDKEPG